MTEDLTAAQHKVGTREEWLAARLNLLKEEKAHTRRGDELAQKRQELPWVRVDKGYRFETDEGSALLSDVFRGRRQLLAYHLMFGPDYTAACPSRTSTCTVSRRTHDGVALFRQIHIYS